MDKEVVEKCLALCQTLTNKHQRFSFSLTMGSDIFTFSTKELVKSSCEKKKKSPSQLRREERRRQDRKRATAADEDTVKVSESSVFVVKCNLCDTSFSSEEELNAHNKDAHKTNSTTLSSPEKERGRPSLGELQLSPILEQRSERTVSGPPSAPVEKTKCILTTGPRGPVCGKTFSCGRDLRYHIHECHYFDCKRVSWLKEDPSPCFFEKFGETCKPD